MRRAHSRLAMALVLLWVGATAIPTTAASAARANPDRLSRSAASSVAEVRELVRLVNRHRSELGCKPLVWDERLARVALRHAQAMARQGFFSHVDRAGNDPFDRLRRAGIRFRAAAENIAMGQADAPEVHAGWMRSRGHRKNLENCEYTHHGIGLHRGHWVHVFARY